jgi:hypothetical protein
MANLNLSTSLIHEGFSMTIFEMTMKTYRRGLDCSRLLRLLSHETKTFFKKGYAEQRAAWAKIVGGSLFIREQRIFLVPPTQPAQIPWCSRFKVCSHSRFLSTKSLSQYEGVTQILYSGQQKRDQRLGSIIQCKRCRTEFRVDTKSFGEYGNATFVTKWQDIGESWFDQKFLRHITLQRLDYISWMYKVQWYKDQPIDQGSICAAFEQKEHFKFEFDSLLTSLDKEELFRKSPYLWE